MTFTVEIKSGADGVAQEVQLFLDQEAIGDLMRVLARLKPQDHEHFFTEEWGGAPLTSTAIGDGNQLVHMLTISRVS